MPLDQSAISQQKQANISYSSTSERKRLGYTAIGRRMGLTESSVRALLAPGAKDKADALQATANMLKNQVDEKEYDRCW